MVARLKRPAAERDILAGKWDAKEEGGSHSPRQCQRDDHEAGGEEEADDGVDLRRSNI